MNEGGEVNKEMPIGQSEIIRERKERVSLYGATISHDKEGAKSPFTIGHIYVLKSGLKICLKPA